MDHRRRAGRLRHHRRDPAQPGHPRPRADPRLNPHGYGDFHGYEHGDPYTCAYRDSQPHGNVESYASPYGYADRDLEPDRDSLTDFNANRSAHGHAYGPADATIYAQADGYRDSYARAHADRRANPYGDSNDNPVATPNRCSFSDRNSRSRSDTVAFADVNRHATSAIAAST